MKNSVTEPNVLDLVADLKREIENPHTLTIDARNAVARIPVTDTTVSSRARALCALDHLLDDLAAERGRAAAEERAAETARAAVAIADALIAELNRQEPVFSTTSKRELREAWDAGAEAALDEFHASPSGPELDRFYAKNPHAEGGGS